MAVQWPGGAVVATPTRGMPGMPTHRGTAPATWSAIPVVQLPSTSTVALATPRTVALGAVPRSSPGRHGSAVALLAAAPAPGGGVSPSRMAARMPRVLPPEQCQQALGSFVAVAPRTPPSLPLTPPPAQARAVGTSPIFVRSHSASLHVHPAATSSYSPSPAPPGTRWTSSNTCSTTTWHNGFSPEHTAAGGSLAFMATPPRGHSVCVTAGRATVATQSTVATVVVATTPPRPVAAPFHYEFSASPADRFRPRNLDQSALSATAGTSAGASQDAQSQLSSPPVVSAVLRSPVFASESAISPDTRGSPQAGHLPPKSPPCAWAATEMTSPRIPQTQVLTLASLRPEQRGSQVRSLDASVTCLPEQTRVDGFGSPQEVWRQHFPLKKPMLSLRDLLPAEDGQHGQSTDESITQMLMHQNSAVSFGSELQEYNEISELSTTKTLVMMQTEGQLSTSSTAKTLPIVHVSNHAYVTLSSAATLRVQGQPRVGDVAEGIAVVEATASTSVSPRIERGLVEATEAPPEEANDLRCATPILHTFTPRSLVYTMSSASVASSGARGVPTDESSLIGTLCGTPASHFSPSASAAGSLRSSTAKSPVRRRSKSSEDGAQSPFPLAPSAAATAAMAATAAVAAAAAPPSAAQPRQVPPVPSPTQRSARRAPGGVALPELATVAAAVAHASSVVTGSTLASAATAASGSAQRQPCGAAHSAPPARVLHSPGRGAAPEVRALSPTVVCAALPHGRAPARLPCAACSPPRARVVQAAGAVASPPPAPSSPPPPSARSPCREVRSPVASPPHDSRPSPRADTRPSQKEISYASPTKLSVHPGPAADIHVQAAEWARRYKAEHGRASTSPEHLCAFVANRGGSIAYRAARGAIAAVK